MTSAERLVHSEIQIPKRPDNHLVFVSPVTNKNYRGLAAAFLAYGYKREGEDVFLYKGPPPLDAGLIYGISAIEHRNRVAEQKEEEPSYHPYVLHKGTPLKPEVVRAWGSERVLATKPEEGRVLLQLGVGEEQACTLYEVAKLAFPHRKPFHTIPETKRMIIKLNHRAKESSVPDIKKMLSFKVEGLKLFYFDKPKQVPPDLYRQLDVPFP